MKNCNTLKSKSIILKIIFCMSCSLLIPILLSFIIISIGIGVGVIRLIVDDINIKNTLYINSTELQDYMVQLKVCPSFHNLTINDISARSCNLYINNAFVLVNYPFDYSSKWISVSTCDDKFLMNNFTNTFTNSPGEGILCDKLDLFPYMLITGASLILAFLVFIGYLIHLEDYPDGILANPTLPNWIPELTLPSRLSKVMLFKRLFSKKNSPDFDIESEVDCNSGVELILNDF